MKIKCKAAECANKCWTMAGILPRVAKNDELLELKEMLKDEGETKHVLLLSLLQSKLYHTGSFIKFRDMGAKDLVWPSIYNAATRDANDKPNSFDWLYSFQKDVFLVDLDTMELGEATNLTREMTQLCAIPSTASVGLVPDQASWKQVDARLMKVLEEILVQLLLFKATLESQGFVDKDEDELEGDQVLPDMLLRVTLINTLVSESSGQLRDGLIALDFLSRSSELKKDLIQAVALAEEGWIEIGSMTCRLSSSVRTECLSDDDEVNWTRLEFLAKPNGNQILSFSNIIYRDDDEDECISEIHGVFLRLPILCCQAVLNHGNPEEFCMTLTVENNFAYTTIQTKSRQLLLDDSNSETGPCYNDQGNVISRLFTDCKTVVRGVEENSEVLISNTDGRLLEVLDYQPRASTDSWPQWITILVTVGVSTLISMCLCIVTLLYCQNVWIRRAKSFLRRLFCCLCLLCSSLEKEEKEEKEGEEMKEKFLEKNNVNINVASTSMSRSPELPKALVPSRPVDPNRAMMVAASGPGLAADAYANRRYQEWNNLPQVL